jgi:hypothetical protein
MQDAGIQYTSDNLSGCLENVYVPFVNGQYLDTNAGLNDNASLLVATSNISTNFSAATTSFFPLYLDYVEFEDAGTNWSGGVFTAPFSTQYTFQVWANGTYTINSGSGQFNLLFHFFVNNEYSTSFVSQFNNGEIVVNQNITISLNQGDTFKVYIDNEGGFITDVDVDLIGNGSSGIDDFSGTGIKLVSMSTALTEATVQMEFNAPDMKQIDFITSIQKMFNLAFVADRTLPNTLRIEPLVEYIGAGNTLDWSSKLDLSKDIMYYPTVDMQKAKFTFTYAEDGDYFNSIYKDNGRIYGRYEITENDFEVINEFATGEEKVELAFASTPSAPVENTDVVVPKFLNSEGQFVQPKPRILYYFADFFVNMYDEVSDSVVQTAVKCLNNYSTMNANVSDSDLNFAPEIPPHTIIANPYDNLYNRWWRNYYRELYDGQARIMEGMFALTLNDIFTFQWSDKIWIVDSWWRVLDIEGYVVGEQDVTKVKLIRLLDIDNDCDIIPVSANLNQTLNWETPNGDPATVTEDCCRRFGYYWNSAKNNCYSTPNNGTRSFITQQVPSLAPTKFGAPVSFGGSISQPVRTITTDYVVTNFDRMIFADTTGGDITIYLPSATTTAGRELIIQKSVAANNVTVQAYTGETVEGSGSVTFSGMGDTITIISNGSDFKSTSSK